MMDSEKMKAIRSRLRGPQQDRVRFDAGVSIAAGALYPFFGLLLSPMIAAAAMSLRSVSVIGNALRLRSAKI